MSASRSSPLTDPEKQWLKEQWRSEFHFLRAYGLSIYEEEDRCEGRAIIRAFISADKEASTSSPAVEAADPMRGDGASGLVGGDSHDRRSHYVTTDSVPRPTHDTTHPDARSSGFADANYALNHDYYDHEGEAGARAAKFQYQGHSQLDGSGCYTRADDGLIYGIENDRFNHTTPSTLLQPPGLHQGPDSSSSYSHLPLDNGVESIKNIYTDDDTNEERDGNWDEILEIGGEYHEHMENSLDGYGDVGYHDEDDGQYEHDYYDAYDGDSDCYDYEDDGYGAEDY